MTPSLRPRIGYTTGRTTAGKDAYAGYTRSIEEAGGEPIHLDGSTRGRETEVLAGLRGLLLTGGYDVDLRLYPHPPDLEGRSPEAVMDACAMEIDRERDLYELPLIQEAIDRDLPVFGICRGVQSLAVALGGRLILDVPSQVPGAVRHHADRDPPRRSAHHEIRIDPTSRLASILPLEAQQSANSRHHQAVRDDSPCPGVIVAVSPADGVAEAMEIPGRRWALGVQWHPEHLSDPELRAEHAPLFRAFVEACR